tara:strand:- start:75585 stop:76193 length:609 start_codon:yes stop_codon:yes gene_type:complete
MIIKDLAQQDYTTTWQAMRDFTDARDETTEDEIWLVEHPAVFTQGQAGKAEHILNAGDISIVQSDRGGQVTYHGPGQLVAYILLDVRRAKLKVRELVTLIETAIIDLLKEYNITANARCDAPGVYVDGAKICSLGLRIRKGCSYHGLALNVDMNLEPFIRINPCGYANMPVTQLSALCPTLDITQVRQRLINSLKNKLISQA